jgi:apolipoprotein N-acyltransferase
VKALAPKIGLAVLGGVLYFLGFVGFDIWPLIFLFQVALLFAIDGVRPRVAFLLGAITGMVANLGGYYWVIHLLVDFAGLDVPLAFLGYVLLCIYQGLAVAFAAWLVAKAKDMEVPPIAALPIAWCASELLYPFIFPSYIGNALYLAPVLTQVVELFGMQALSVLISLVAASIYEAATLRRPKRAIAGAGALVATLAYGLVRIPMVEAETAKAKTMKVAMVQTNLGARDKAEKRTEFIRRHREMSKEVLLAHPDLDLIVWPESAYNRWIPKEAESVRAEVTEGIDVPLIFGALTFDGGPRGAPERRIYNTAILTSSTGAVVEQFDKVELLAFGETIPLVDTFPSIKKWFPRSSTFTRGTRFVNFRVGDARLMPMICYEDIIPSFVRAMWDRAGPPNILVNVTNDSWYGDTHEPLIHLVLATFRTIETRRPMIRSTNTGISAFVDPVGRITARTGQWTRETLVGEVPVVEGGPTLYMRIGDVIGWASVIAVAAGLIRSRRRR